MQVKGCCPLDCQDSCSWVAHVDDDRVVRVEGAKDHPVTRGVLCAKVRDYEARVTAPGRLLRPLRRVGAKGSGAFEPISWDEALDTIAAGGQPAGRSRMRRVGLGAARGRASDECRPRGDAARATHRAVGAERADDLSSPMALHRAGACERCARHCHRSSGPRSHSRSPVQQRSSPPLLQSLKSC